MAISMLFCVVAYTADVLHGTRGCRINTQNAVTTARDHKRTGAAALRSSSCMMKMMLTVVLSVMMGLCLFSSECCIVDVFVRCTTYVYLYFICCLDICIHALIHKVCTNSTPREKDVLHVGFLQEGAFEQTNTYIHTNRKHTASGNYWMRMNIYDDLAKKRANDTHSHKSPQAGVARKCC